MWIQLLTLACCLAAYFVLPAQSQIPNGDFESWTAGTGGQFEEPSSNWWTSLNALKLLGAPATVVKTTDAHSGTYAAKMSSAQWNTLLLPGLLVCGDFDATASTFLVTGQPFTDRPAVLNGWFKYFPANNDSAGIAALLTRWNAAAGRRDTLAIAAIVLYDTVANYTAYNLPFVYSSLTLAPDSIILALVSSQGGSQFIGQVGSTLYADDLGFDYIAMATDAQTPIGFLSPNPVSNGQLHITLTSGQAQLRISDVLGRTRLTQALRGRTHELALADLEPGMYFVELTQGTRRSVERILIR
jgi:hypothetical protein